jgi:20S proteasome alpha/beta subunit
VMGADQYTVWNTDSSSNFLSNIGVVSGGTFAFQSLENSFHQDLNNDGTIGLSPPTVIEAHGTTSLVQLLGTYALYPVGGSSGPQLKLNGVGVAAGLGPFASWTAIGAEQTAGGYEVAWKVAGADQYTVWNTDSNGNFLSNIGVVSGSNSFALQSLETSFQQDLNGDGIIGLPSATVIEANGSTSLVQLLGTYALFPVGGSSGPQLKLNGVGVAAGLGPFASWKAIGAEQTAGGYEVAWKVTGADQYTVWNTDSNGNFLSNIGVVSGGSYALQSLETSFQQDLNGDGIVGLPPATVIEANGSTSLVQLLGTYALYPVGGSSGPQLKLNGVGVAAGLGPFASWKAISAEQTAGGYEVAWKVTGADQYTVWNTDSNGNFLSNIGVVSSGSYALQSLEPSFHQDLNGDGRMGLPPPTVIETNGSTSLVQIADAYFLYPGGGSSGPQLKFNGAAVTAGSGQWAGWTAFSAEQTAGGYEVAWKVAGADQYTVWNTDSSGNFLSNIGVVSGGSYALQVREASFHQDLNGDGRIGPPPPQVIEANGATSLVQIADAYFMYPVGGSSGPQLPITTSSIAPWTPIGAERTASGYEVAFRINGADQYMVWNTDSNGNYVSSPIGVVSGGSSALESMETSFHQDLNNDGIIGSTTFDITVNYSGDPTYQSYFAAAAQRWQQIITADLPDVDSATYGHIDDLLISASVTSIDGPGGILGQAQADLFRSTGSHLPYHGIMQFDSADLAGLAANGQLYYVILHEMGHVLGFGSSLWSADGLTIGSQYIGADAVNAYRQLGSGPTNSVPLETTGGRGTALVHWSESVFSNELMTGYISGTPDPLSILTVGAMQDLGYTVNYAAADPYSLPGHIAAQDGSSSIVANAGQLASDFGNVGTLGLDTGSPPGLMNDEVGNVSPGGGSVALLTNYIASTFATPAAEGTGAVAAMQPSAQDVLTRPAA